MKIDFGSQTPIFLQLSQGLEDEILSGIYREGEQIPSITELAASYKINPATALKGINLLVDAGISAKRVEAGLKELELEGSDIQGLLITHEHSDHIKGLGVLSRKYHLPIYGTKETLDEIVA